MLSRGSIVGINYGSGSGNTYLKTKILAQENISAFLPVIETGYIADSSNYQHRNRISGIAINDIVENNIGYVLAEGYIKNIAWTWIKGELIFLNGKTLSASPPTSGFIQILGRAKSETEIYVNIFQATLL